MILSLYINIHPWIEIFCQTLCKGITKLDIIHSLSNPYFRRQNQVTCQNKDKTEERFISFTSVCRDLDFIKEMKYPNEKIESMTSIMLGDSSSDGLNLNVDNNEKDPKEGNGVGNFFNSLLSGDLVEAGQKLVKGITNTGISGKGT